MPLILPGDPLFDETLGLAPPPVPPGEWVFVAETGSGVLRPASQEEAREYLYGGEYDQRLGEIDDALDEGD